MKPPEDNHQSILRFLLIAYGFTWLVWLPGVLNTYNIIPDLPWLPFFAIGTFGPLVAAVSVLNKEGGWSKVREWLCTGFQKKFSWRWWAILITIPLLAPPLGLLIFWLTGGEIAEIPFFKSPWIILPTFLLMVVMGGGNEEFGWRGFLLPRLLQRFTPLQADLILIPLHAFWHIPLFLNANTTQYTYPFWLFLIFGLGFTPLINRVFQGTGGSILAAILCHAFINTSLDTFPPVGHWVNHSPIPLIGGLVLICTVSITLFSNHDLRKATL